MFTLITCIQFYCNNFSKNCHDALGNKQQEKHKQSNTTSDQNSQAIFFQGRKCFRQTSRVHLCAKETPSLY